jgi:hypothetical protein
MTTDTENPVDRIFRIYNEFHYTCDTARFQKLFSRVELFRLIVDIPGDIIDAGAFKGVSTLQFAHLIEAYKPNSRAKVLSFDTFDANMPGAREDEKAGVESLMKEYEATAFDVLTQTIKQQNLGERIKLIQGDITETIPAYFEANPGSRIAFLHCDLDIYAPTLATLKAAWPRVVPGGVVVFDEYAIDEWGESDAVDEFFTTLDNPPRLRTLPQSPTPTAYCIKGE